MPFRSIMDLDAKGHRVFLRAELEAPIVDGAVQDARRLQESLPTLRHLLGQGASVVLATGPSPSLAPVAEWLRAAGFDIRMASGVIEAEAAALGPGQILLLELPRDCEDAGQALTRLADTYVNDAFGVTHRPHPSVTGMVPCFGPDRIAAGFRLEQEVEALDRIARNPERPLALVLGEARMPGQLELIRHFLGRAQTILVGGTLGYTFLQAQGTEVGSSLHEEGLRDVALQLIQDAEARGTRLLLPADHVVAAEATPDATCEITYDQAIPLGMMGLDIGPETVATYLQEIRQANTILWSGPMGAFAMEPFASGTLALAEELADAADRGAFVLLHGGDTLAAAEKAGVAARMSHVSTGGDACIEYLLGRELPGLTALSTRY